MKRRGIHQVNSRPSLGMIVVMLSGFLLQSACVSMVSVHPLSDPDQAQVDPRMQGTWRLVTEKEDPVFLHIGILNAKKMVAVIVEHKPDARLETMRFAFFPTQTQTRRYVNVRMEDIADDMMPPTQGYIFIKYQITGQTQLAFYSMTRPPVVVAIRDGALKGRLTYGRHAPTGGAKATSSATKKRLTAVTISDSSANILQFVDGGDHSILFSESMRFIRVD